MVRNVPGSAREGEIEIFFVIEDILEKKVIPFLMYSMRSLGDAYL